MAKLNKRKILTLVLWIIGVTGLISALAFVSIEQKKVLGKNINIKIESDDETEFVNEEVIKGFLKEKGDTLMQQKMEEINVYDLENALNAHPSIENAEVSATVTGNVNISIKQRKPIARVYNLSGENYYIDENAKLMPNCDNYTARVPIVNGFIAEKYSSYINKSLVDLSKDSLTKSRLVLDDVFLVCNFIDKDSTLKSLIHQVYVNEKKEIELMPVVGSHKIILGNSEDLEDKFENLQLFYTQGLNNTNGWNKYSIVNLKYKNQVVCTKKQ